MPGSPRLRVLSVAHTAVSRDAGRQRYHPFATAADLDVHLVVPRRWYQFGRWQDADLGHDPGVTVHVEPILLPRGGPAKWYLHWYPRLGRLVKAVQPAVIHLWEEPWSVVALQAALLRPRGVALVLEVDQNILKRLPPPFGWIRRFVLARTTVVLSRSDEATAVVRACGYRGLVQPIGYGVDRTVFAPRPAQTGRRPGSLRLGYVGRIVPEKGLDDALDALVLTRDPVTLAIMGEGPHEAALRARVAELGLQHRVTFQGWGSPAAVADFIRGLDALILLTRTTPSVREQFGRVIAEAQSCGVPVIGSASGSIPNVVGPGGWIVPERNSLALSQLLDKVTAAEDLLRRRSADGIANVEARFSYQRVSAALANCWWQARNLTTDGSLARSRRVVKKQDEVAI